METGNRLDNARCRSDFFSALLLGAPIRMWRSFSVILLPWMPSRPKAPSGPRVSFGGHYPLISIDVRALTHGLTFAPTDCLDPRGRTISFEEEERHRSSHLLKQVLVWWTAWDRTRPLPHARSILPLPPFTKWRWFQCTLSKFCRVHD
jgi:hypothetical protein